MRETLERYATRKGFRLMAVPVLLAIMVLCVPSMAIAASAPGGPSGPPASSPAATPGPVPAAPAPAVQAGQNPSAPVDSDFRYDPTGRRDPFKSLLVLQEKKRDVSMLPPVQQIELISFKVVGTIIDAAGGNRAMLIAPDGKTYVVKKGDVIGKNEGEVISITVAGITVKEKFLDYMNKETFVTTVLKAVDKR
jgi:type IV pilus assembly protein PilP